MAYLSKAGFLEILSRSRGINSIDIAKQMDMSIHNHMPSCDERDFLHVVSKAFKGEDMQPQFSVLQYRIDLYFPKHFLAIEFDEKFHNQRKNSMADFIREQEIYKEIGCTFIRFTRDDDILEIINKIFRHIMNRQIQG